MNSNKITSTQWCLCLALLLPFFLSACSGGGGSNADTTAPTVSNTSPAGAATDVERNSSITATFNEDIFAITVDAASYTLTTPGTGNTAGNVTFDGASNIASFTPESTLAPLSDYTATLSTAITDLSGNSLTANYRWSFTTADRAWGSPVLIETNDEGSARDPQIAFDSNGNAFAVWQQSDGTRLDIWANRFDGSSWGSAELIESDNLGDARAPQIAINSNGNAFVVWQQSDGTRSNIWANRFDGTAWETAELIETNNAGNARDPQIAFDSNGNALAVWAQFDGTRNNIWANRFDGSIWGTAEMIETNEGNVFKPQITFDSNGNAFAVWWQITGGFNIWVNFFDGTNWGAAEQIDTNERDSFRPQIAFNNNGNAFVVWEQFDGNSSIWANHFNGTIWGMAELIETNDAGNARDPQIAFDNNGNAFTVWEQFDGTRNNIWANRFNGTIWGTAELIETDNAGDARRPQIAFDNNGNALAVWEQEGSSRDNIRTNRFNGTKWGTAEQIDTNERDAYSPQVAFGSNGNAFAIWQQFDGTRSDIWANRFD